MVVICKRDKRVKLKWCVMMYLNGSRVKVADLCQILVLNVMMQKSVNQITSLYVRKTLVSGLHNSNNDIKISGCCPQKKVFLIFCPISVKS